MRSVGCGRALPDFCRRLAPRQVRRFSKRNHPRSRTVIYWKCEEPSADPSEDGRLDDAGPAWLRSHDEYGHVTSEPVAGGDWITRSDALALSAGMGYTLSLDD